MSRIKQKIDPKTARQILEEYTLRNADLSVLDGQKHIDFYNDMFKQQRNFIESQSKRKVALCGRRCLAGDTLIATPTGPTPIKDLRIGDIVYGYEDGAVKPTTVSATWDNGVQETVEIVHNRKTLFRCTLNHRFLNDQGQLVFAEDILKQNIERRLVQAPMGTKHQPHAYAIGALLGDGCSRETGNQIYISSEDHLIPAKVADILGSTYKKCGGDNYKYTILTKKCARYDEWCDGYYAHEKCLDTERIKKWNRESCLAFIAGLLDTDGSVYLSTTGSLVIRFSMQARPVIECVKHLIMALWQYDANISIDNRKKYKNGPVYETGIYGSFFSKRALKELTPHLVTPRKKYKKKYDKLPTTEQESTVRVTLGKRTHEPTYNFTVDNSTNLFVFANGGLISKQSGKSVACAYYLVKNAYEKKCDVAYIALSRKSAKDIIWYRIVDILDRYKISYETDMTALQFRLSNGSRICVYGASSEREVEKYRGMHYDLVIIDECGSPQFLTLLDNMIDNILGPTLFDTGGTMCLISSPGPICSGLFYRISEGLVPNWELHHWTVLDNQKFPRWKGKSNWRIEAVKLLDELKEENGWTDDTPVFRREWLGQFVKESVSLVYKFNPDRNVFAQLPNDIDNWQFLIGIDFGIVDSSAIIVGAYSEDSPVLYVVDCYKNTGIGPGDLADIIHAYYEKYEPIGIDADANGLGMAFITEVEKRYQLPIEKAAKKDKIGFIEIMNDEFTKGHIKIQENLTDLLEEITKYQWRDIENKILPEGAQDHCCDALLYMWRRSLHFMGKTPKPKPEVGTDEWEDELFSDVLAKYNNNDKEWWDI